MIPTRAQQDGSAWLLLWIPCNPAAVQCYLFIYLLIYLVCLSLADLNLNELPLCLRQSLKNGWLA